MQDVGITLMLVLGLASSLHCVTMCGPLIAVASAPLRPTAGATSPARLLLWQATYNLGRGLTYVVIGGVLGAVGQALTSLFAAKLVGGIVQLALGLLIVALGVWQLRKGSAVSTAGDGPLTRAIRSVMTSRRSLGMLGLGLLTGLLPCGVLYAAFARSLAAQSFSEGAALMGAFWLGTVPLLAGVGLLSGQVFRAAGRYAAVLLCVAMVATGGWLGVKGYRNITAPEAPAAACHGDHRH